MTTTLQPLLSLKAGDFMTHPVLLIPRKMSLSGAAHLLTQAGVSGAPVVDEAGCCIGVLSTTDFVHYTDKARIPPHAETRPVYSWQLVDADGPPPECAETYMNRDPVTATPGVHIGEIARMMIDAHIHRVIVVDNVNRPIGIVSSTDILAAVAQADCQW